MREKSYSGKNNIIKLDNSFYQRDDVVKIAKELIGKCIFTNFNNNLTAGIITETEAYKGIIDKASHSYGNKRTKRTEIMYHDGGIAYIYLCYGIHSLFNIVTNKKDIPDAVLIRSIVPYYGLTTILSRLNKVKYKTNYTNGPGKVTKALGINYKHTGIDLNKNIIWLENIRYVFNKEDIIIGKRIGIDYAEEDSLLPYRFKLNIKKLHLL